MGNGGCIVCSATMVAGQLGMVHRISIFSKGESPRFCHETMFWEAELGYEARLHL